MIKDGVMTTTFWFDRRPSFLKNAVKWFSLKLDDLQ